MSEFRSSRSRSIARAGRRRVLEQELPVLAAIAVLLSAWLVLALGGG